MFCVSFSALSNSSSSGVNATVNRHSKFHNLALIRRQQTVDSVNNNEKQGNNAIIAHNKISNCVDFFSSVPESNGLFWLQKRIKDITRYFRLGNCKMGHIKNVNICSGHRELKHHKQNEKFCHWFNNCLDLIFQCTLAIVKPNREFRIGQIHKWENEQREKKRNQKPVRLNLSKIRQQQKI